MTRYLLCLLALTILCVTHAHADLPDIVAHAAFTSGIDPNAISLWVAPAMGGPPQVRHRANQLMSPASVMKLLTSYAALDQFGPAWTWRTNAYLHGKLHDGILDGDVVVVGSGDPSLTWDRLGQWLRDWRSRGLRQIHGNIIIDDSLYAPTPDDTNFDAAPHRAYNAQPAAFLVNFGTITLRLTPGSVDAPVDVMPLTPVMPLRVVNHLRASAGACLSWRNALHAIFTPNGRGLTLTLEGKVPAACGESELNLKVADDLHWAALVIRAQWQELGGSWQGEVLTGTTQTDLPVFSTWISPSLAEVLRDMNKWSNNVMAREIFLDLGVEEGGYATRDHSVAHLQEWMPRQGLDPTQWVLENGSGLSRNERTTTEQLGMLLQTVWQSSRMPDYVASLPVIGMDGTMRNHLTDSPLAGRGYVKTGTLDGVKSAAGYVLDNQGHWQAFALLINHPRAASAEIITDAVLKQIYDATLP